MPGQRWVIGSVGPYVEQDLDKVFDGEVKDTRDAREGLRLMAELLAVKRGRVPAERLVAPGRTPSHSWGGVGQ